MEQALAEKIVIGRPLDDHFDEAGDGFLFQPLRYIVMACAFILVYLMVARSVING